MSRHELHFYDALLVELISTLLMIFDHTAFNRATVWRLEFETAQCGRSVLSTLKFWSLHGNLIGIEAIIEICFITNELTIVLIQLSYDYVNCAMHKAPTGTFNSIFTQKFCCFITVTMCLDLRTMIVRTSIKYFWIIAQWEKTVISQFFSPWWSQMHDHDVLSHPECWVLTINEKTLPYSYQSLECF